MAVDFAAGCIGGMAGIMAGHPLDTLKVHVQSGRGGGAMECARALVRNASLTALYRGVGPPLLGVAGVNAIVFGSYGAVHRSLSDTEKISSHAIAGGAAGLLQSVLLSPVELVKTRQQLGTASNKTWTAIRHVWRAGGVRALYRGLGMTAARDTPAFAIYFSSYEALTRGNKSAARVFLAGGAAGMLSWVLLYPLDVVKSRLQGDASGMYRGAWDCAVRSVRAEGWACMRRGLGAVTLRAFISNGACFSAVAWTERAWSALPVVTERVLADTRDLAHLELHVVADLHDIFPHFQCA